MTKYYAVKEGRTPGIYLTWEECKKQVQGYSGAVYKKFSTKQEAENFMGLIIEGKEIKKDSDIVESYKSGEMIAYVDGSFDISDHSFSCGAVLYYNDMMEEYSKRYYNHPMAEMRNVAGEIKGAMCAMKRCVELGLHTLYLHYDYAGIAHWALGEWKRNKEGTIGYKEYYDSIKDALKVHFIKVAAHTGIEGNERADTLAKEAK